MTDIHIYPLPFGGMAMEPASPDGRDFCDGVDLADMFLSGDACMEGFLEGSIGLQPWDIDDWLTEAQTRGLAIRRGTRA